ncbi:MAG: outer membrane protein beta-barrel protein [Rhodospirillales bacterium]|jgi:OOP family OmpA-OmpF porin|nr:outer membrane protein beta-barrel protein [Rhodospirillales bacterium]MDB5380997.1 outer membrane protein beta-barrel protein [Rhodospirillales bacterium]
MRMRTGLLAATILAAPVAAHAQLFAPPAYSPTAGVYIGAGAGINYMLDSKDNGIKIQHENPGWVGVLSVGYGFGNGFRLEVEGSARSNDARRVRGTGFTGNTEGETRTYAAMFNVLYELPITIPFARPYIGGGIGYAFQHTDINGNTGPGNVGPGRFRVDDQSGNFAYQGIAGLAIPIASVPGLSLTAEYRFFGTLAQDQRATFAGRGIQHDYQNLNHSVLAGLRYSFGQRAVAQAAPEAAPPPATARTYLVFFDWNRADLTDRARQIIGEAASAAPRVQSTRIEVAGHADRSGTPAYNQGLSQRRANTVAAELVSRGVSREMISISAFGETRPLVPTADGVREPQNRRVEIVLR